MRTIELFIENIKTFVTEVDTDNAGEISEFLSANRSDTDAYKLELSNLDSLIYIPNVESLILTGGIPTESGLRALYRHTEIKRLILDYEETESDENGIDLSSFPSLSYILSRSDLNIRSSNNCRSNAFKSVILNHYRHGHRKIDFAPNFNIYQEKKFLFFSTEAKDPAARMIMNILIPIEKNFSEISRALSFSEALDSVGVIPVCVPSEMIRDGFGKERKYVSLKKRYADIRLRIDYEHFISSSAEEQRKICLSTVKKSINYVTTKDKTFDLRLFDDVFERAEKQV